MAKRTWLLLAAIVACVPGAPGPGPGPAAAAVEEITILHLNDLHARLLPDERGRGGYAYVAAVLERERAAAQAHLTLHGGDLVQGTPVSTLYRGVPAVELANGLGLDVHCLGNHEFDYGWEQIREFVAVSEFDTVSANVIDGQGNTLVAPYVIRQVGALRVAVVGAMTESLAGLTVSELLGPWRAAGLVSTLRPVVAEAAQSSDMVIVLGHLSSGEAEAVLEQLVAVSVVVQGHGHRGWEEPMVLDGRIAVEASGYGRTVGRLRLRYDRATRRVVSHEWELLPVRTDEVAPNEAVGLGVEAWEARVSAQVDVPIGRAVGRLDRRQVRSLIEAAMLRAAPADFAYMNAGGVRDDLPAGEILARHIWNVMPFDNRVVTIELTGNQVLRLPHLTRDEMVIDAGQIDPGARYRVVTSDFTALGWQDRGLDISFADTGLLLRDAIIDHVRVLETLR